MKKIIYILLVPVLIVITSCEKDFLDKAPIVGTTEGNFYRTQGRCDCGSECSVCFDAISNFTRRTFPLVLG
jgi:hypothetical protein